LLRQNEKTKHFFRSVNVIKLKLGLVVAASAFACTANAQALAPWSNAVPVEVPEWQTRDEAGNCQSIPGTSQVSCRFFSGANQSDITVLDGAANRPGLQMKRTGARFFGFARGTPGTLEMLYVLFGQSRLLAPSGDDLFALYST
jgi:hypothetical protein